MRRPSERSKQRIDEAFRKNMQDRAKELHACGVEALEEMKNRLRHGLNEYQDELFLLEKHGVLDDFIYVRAAEASAWYQTSLRMGHDKEACWNQAIDEEVVRDLKIWRDQDEHEARYREQEEKNKRETEEFRRKHHPPHALQAY